MKKILSAFFILTFSSHAYAQDAKTWRASIGLGLGIKKNLRVENQYEKMDKKVLTKTLPFIQGSIGRFSLGAQGISVSLFGNQGMNASVFINRAGDRYQGLGMTPRKDSAFVGFSGKFMKYGLSVSRDINGRSKGYITNFNYGDFFKLSDSLVLRAGVSLEWLDDKYAEYYYSVRSYEVTSKRREHHLKNYFQPGINLMPIYNLSEKSSIIMGANLKLLPKSVRQSPTMNGDKLDIGGLIAFSYAL